MRFFTHLSEESLFKPKPMLDISDNPILWHILKHDLYLALTIL